MDIVSIMLLGALNVPVLIFLCKLVQRAFFRQHHDFWRSLLSWSFDPHAFLDKNYKHNHLAVLLLSISFASCILLVFVEYEMATRLVAIVNASAPLKLSIKL